MFKSILYADNFPQIVETRKIHKNFPMNRGGGTALACRREKRGIAHFNGVTALAIIVRKLQIFFPANKNSAHRISANWQ
jgi:hypothetical protein